MFVNFWKENEENKTSASEFNFSWVFKEQGGFFNSINMTLKGFSDMGSGSYNFRVQFYVKQKGEFLI